MNAFAEIDQLFQSERPCFTVETASNLVNLAPDLEKAIRIEELSDKANAGKLTTDEEQEYWTYIYAGRMMAILKLQARLFLKKAA
jgi:hypothetical protein